MTKYTSDQIVCGKTLLEWFTNKPLSCLAGWPEEVQKIARSKDLGIGSFLVMNKNGDWRKYRKGGKDLQAGGVYKLWGRHEWTRVLNALSKAPLKNCPFCGEEVWMSGDEIVDKYIICSIVCPTCGVKMEYDDNSAVEVAAEVLAKSWNTREQRCGTNTA